MDNETFETTALERWEALQALLELHPEIADELTAELLGISQRFGDYPAKRSWLTSILSGFEVAKCQSIVVASQELGISVYKVQLTLATISRDDWSAFGQWIVRNPEIFAKVFSRFGLDGWSNLRQSVEASLKYPSRIRQIVSSLVAQPDIAQLLADQFDELYREVGRLEAEIRRLNGDVERWREKAAEYRDYGRHGR